MPNKLYNIRILIYILIYSIIKENAKTLQKNLKTCWVNQVSVKKYSLTVCWDIPKRYIKGGQTQWTI